MILSSQEEISGIKLENGDDRIVLCNWKMFRDKCTVIEEWKSCWKTSDRQWLIELFRGKTERKEYILGRNSWFYSKRTKKSYFNSRKRGISLIKILNLTLIFIQKSFISEDRSNPRIKESISWLILKKNSKERRNWKRGNKFDFNEGREIPFGWIVGI